MKTPEKIFLALIIVALVQALVYYPQLPERVASHFDGGGRPNGWSAKPGFFAINFGIIAVLALLFVLLPRTLGRVPLAMVSLPNRDYWFSPERREGTLGFIRDQMSWLGTATVALMVGMMEVTIRANLRPEPVLSPVFIWIFAGFLVFMAVWTIRFVSRFTRVHPG
jgi:serine/threonine-protein kinase